MKTTLSRYRRRKVTSAVVMSMTLLAALIALIPLFLILYQLISKGTHALSFDFFTKTPVPVGEPGGGMGNAIAGTLLLIGLSSVIGLPLGIFGGMFLSEYSQNRFSTAVRFAADILGGTPSIVIGLFVYTLVVMPMHHFSALAGGIALGIMMIPTVMRTTEEMLALVPQNLREGAYALGIPYWRTLVSIVLKTARSGIVTGILLAIARVTGETAPLLFTALGNQFWSFHLKEPIASLPLQIFTYAISPFEEWQSQAWAGALTLIAIVLMLNIGARLLIRQRFQSRRQKKKANYLR